VKEYKNSHMSKRIFQIMLLALTSIVSIIIWNQTGAAQLKQQPSRYLHDSWNTENGLPQNDVTQLIQTRDGYLWLGTNGGLVRFDGIRFTIFDSGNTPELRSNRILALAEDRDGTLWIGTQNGGLTSYSQGRFRNYTTRDGLPDESIYDIEADQQGNLWLSTNGGLLRLTNGRFTLYTTRDGLPSNGSGDLHEAPDGSLWFRSADFVMRFYEGRFERYGIKDLPKGWTFKVSSMTVAGDGSVWLSTAYGLAHLQDGNFILLTSNRNPDAPVMPSMFVVKTFKDRAGNLRLLTSSGLAHYQDGQVILDTPIPELSRLSISLWAMLEDREGNLWLGTSVMGLHRFRPRQVTAYTAETGLSDQGFIPITGDGAGGLWLGNTDFINSLYHFQDGKFTSYNINAVARSLYRDHAGTLWIGTNKGLFRLQDGQLITEHPLNPELRETLVEAIYEDREGNLWVGTGRDEEQDGALYRLKDGVTKKYQMSEGLVANDVRFITEDQKGALWVGTTRGMSRFKDERFTNYTTEQGLSNNFVREIHEDANGTLWIGTYGGGLNRFKDGHFIAITTKNGLFDNIVSRILEDDHGNFWMSGNRGIYRASRKELNEFADGRLPSVTSISYGVEDGMKINETNGGAQPAGWKTPDGRLWFPTIRGVVTIDPDNLNPLPPPVYIEQVLIGQTPVDARQPIEVRPGQGDLEIHYTGLSFTAPEKMRFKYKLEGYDGDWVDAHERRVAYYTNISPGRYTFRVMASNNDGVWNTQDATIRIVVIPPFWRTWWFVSLVLLSIIATGVFAYRRRIVKLKRANAAQQAFSRRLIESQETERKRIAAELHDSLGQQLLVIKNRALLALHTSASHEEAVGELNEISDATSQALDEVREIAYNLRPFQIDQLGLTKALESMLKKVSQTSGIDFSIMIDLIDDLYSKEAEMNIYRIVQESANNIVRHSEATKAEVEIKRDRRGVTIRIHDNGKGFASDSTTSPPRGAGLGIAGISERARILGGKHEVHSAPGEGTTIIIKLGLQNNDGGEAHID
jgi:signal transduction histidine kinase/ligand-binding sensor domain-containing protein